MEELKKQLEDSKDYNYSCSEVTTKKLCKTVYETFSATESSLGAKQHYFIRRQENTMIVMVITLFGEDKLEELLSLINPL